MARQASRTTPNHGYRPLRGADFERAHSSVVLGEDVRDRRRGFTIVELLIVVVVIAILAAITIVAYNGINNRAKASAASSAAQQAAKKVMTYAITNAETYPTTLTDAGVTDSGSTSYQYRVDNSTNPRSFCLTATSNNISYFVSSVASIPSAGACAGHGADGVATITNLITNPSVEIDAATWTAPYAWGSVTMTGAPYDGVSSARFTRTAISADSRTARHGLPSLSPGTYLYSAWVYVSDAPIGSITPSIVFNGSAGSSGAVTSTGGAIGQWRRVSRSFTVTSAGGAYIEFQGGQNQTGSLFIDAAMLTQGSSQVNYGDGGSPGWIWNGAAHGSSSTGPVL